MKCVSLSATQNQQKHRQNKMAGKDHSPIRNKTPSTDTSCFDDQQCPWVILSVAATLVVALSKHRPCALVD